MPDLTTIGAITGILAGIGGLVLGVWNRFEQWRESRARRDAHKPHFTASVGPPDNEGWRPMQLGFYNPAELPFDVESIKVTSSAVKLAPVLEPGVGLAPYGGVGIAPNKSVAGQTVYVAWMIESFGVPNRTTSRKIFCRSMSSPISFSIHTTAREVSASRRKFRMQADATIRISNPQAG